jgi:hypothetical protein
LWKRFLTVQDLAEMKRRGYDQSILEEAEPRVERGVRAEKLKEQIIQAFAGVKLGNGVGLRETAP